MSVTVPCKLFGLSSLSLLPRREKLVQGNSKEKQINTYLSRGSPAGMAAPPLLPAFESRLLPPPSALAPSHLRTTAHRPPPKTTPPSPPYAAPEVCDATLPTRKPTPNHGSLARNDGGTCSRTVRHGTTIKRQGDDDADGGCRLTHKKRIERKGKPISTDRVYRAIADIFKAEQRTHERFYGNNRGRLGTLQKTTEAWAGLSCDTTLVRLHRRKRCICET